MKTWMFLTLSARLAAGEYVGIDEKMCTDQHCNSCKDGGVFKANTCLETSLKGLYIIGNCSDDGSEIVEFTFNDDKCTHQTGRYTTKARSCNADTSSGGYRLSTCEKSLIRNWTVVQRSDCAQDNYCWTCKTLPNIKTNACVPTGKSFTIASCNTEGTKVILKQFSDSQCSKSIGQESVASGSCSGTDDGRYGIWSCYADMQVREPLAMKSIKSSIVI
eukprot:TRINITY_DN20591_c3_g1_i1.p1 TRINITY_DN20591_c3_g1~~TRINITY_DN20591_c3_g1_i1.p1  ORF type:complete len:218 (-),score=26.89 TRINITY_DN20591_c3_g1_i1:335-988(-)